MSTLTEIEAATDALQRDELRKLLRFVTTRLRTGRHELANSPTAPVAVVAVGKGGRKKTQRKSPTPAKTGSEWHPPAPKAMGKFLAPESEWTDLCHR